MNEAAEFGAAAPGLVTRHGADARWNGAPSLVLPGAPSRVGGGEQFFAVCILLLSSGAFVNLFPGEHGVEFEEQGLWFAQLLWAILFAAIIFIARKRFREVGRLAWDNKPFVLLLGWTCVSVIWSIDQQVTLRHFAALLASSFFGIYLALRYDLPGQLRLLSISLGIVIASSIVACVLFPDYAIDKTIVEEPAWQGVVSHKNALGKLAILAILILTLYLLKRRRRVIVLTGIVLLSVLVLLTTSKTALVYLVGGAVAFPFVRAFQRNPARRKRVVLFALSLFGCLIGYIILNWENFVEALGKDPMLTGRFALWALSLTWIAQRPLTGYGYDAFWSSYYGPAADVRAAVNWLLAPHAHNGLINLLLDLGLVGVSFFGLTFVVAYWRALKLSKTSRTAEGIWPIAFLTFVFCYNLTEGSFMSRTDLFWILYVGVIFSLMANRSRVPSAVQ